MEILVNASLVRAPGDRAMLGDIEVRICALQIQPGPRVAYEVVWTLDGRHEVWVEAFELTDAKDAR